MYYGLRLALNSGQVTFDSVINFEIPEKRIKKEFKKLIEDISLF